MPNANNESIGSVLLGCIEDLSNCHKTLLVVKSKLKSLKTEECSDWQAIAQAHVMVEMLDDRLCSFEKHECWKEIEEFVNDWLIDQAVTDDEFLDSHI